MLTASLIFVLGVVVNGVDIDYPENIGAFDYEASDPDNDEGPYAFLDSDCMTAQSDDDLSTGCQVNPSANPGMTWGTVSGSTVGMVGDFYATNVVPGSNPDTGNAYTYYTITSVEISFTGGCLQNMNVVSKDSSFYYTDANGQSVVNSITVSAEKVSGVTTFKAELPYVGIQLFSGQDIGFKIQTNTYCEVGMNVVEFAMEGEPAETADPTEAPSKRPTATPTTATPTMAPTAQCRGEVTWGDPHFQVMAVDNDNVAQFNYQGLGWYFYIAPCDMEQYEHFPFFLLSKHTACYWMGNLKGCINDNLLILNTKPDPLKVQFNYRNLDITIPDSGTYTVSSNALNGNGEINTNKNYKDKDGERLVIDYNDDNSIFNAPINTTPNQSGKLKIFYDSDVIVVQLWNVQYDALPRRCNKNTGKGEDLECGTNVCGNRDDDDSNDELVIDIRNKGSWTYFSCPSCLRNIACGLMGKYYRGDCTQSQLYDSTDLCSQILVDVTGAYWTDAGQNVAGRARGDGPYKSMADTWEYNYVQSYLQSTHSLSTNFDVDDAMEKNTIFKHEKKVKPFSEGRSFNIEAASYYDGYCQNNMTHIKIVNETCRQSTVVKYEKCCKEIGICNILWLGCIEDYCSCTEPAADKPANITDEWCLDIIIGQSMNATCSVDALWPTATPTAAPTKQPTGLVAGLPQGEKAEDLIWLYLIFVVLFVVIAGVAYWYYRKKNVGGKASFQQDVDSGLPNTSVGY